MCMLLLIGVLGAATAVDGPPAPQVVRIMPLGDSITEGFTAESSYRSWLWRRLSERGSRVDFVGGLHGARRGEGDLMFDADHEGHWGWRADEVRERVLEWASKARPDVVLLHLGHNDLFVGESAASTVAELASIVRLLRAENPRVVVLIAQVIPSAHPLTGAINELNRRIPPMARRLTTEESPILAVDLAGGFDPATDTVDGVHPNEAGARKMAAAWFEALEPLLSGSSGPED